MTEMKSPHPEEKHKSQRSNWLRASILGVDDGIVSTSSIMVGVLAAQADYAIILTTGIASLVAGALSMAVGEYVSVSSQRDSELADIAIERRALQNNPEGELAELANIYESRGLDKELALTVARQLQSRDAVEAHARDELGISTRMRAHPIQAASASALSFAIGSSIPIVATILSKDSGATILIIASLVALAIAGAIGASIGGGNKLVAGLRVFIGGGVAMAVTAFIGHLIGRIL